jgi:hypothetical protein
MSCCKDITRIRVTVPASAIHNGAISAGYAVHDGILAIPCAAFREGGRGKILQVYGQLNNDNSSAITTAFTLHIHNNADLTAQTKGIAASTNDTDHAAFQGKINLGSFVAMAGDGNVSDSMSKEVNLEYNCADNDNQLYFFVTSDGAPTFDDDATFTFDFIMEKY